METLLRWTEPPGHCDYHPNHICIREYVHVSELDAEEYMNFLLAGWRRFGHTLFRLRCSGLDPCRSLRVDVARFRPDRSQRRARKANETSVRLCIGKPSVSKEKLALFDRFHINRSETRGWINSDPYDAEEYTRTFVSNPFPIQEWCYFVGNRLAAVGYVDHLIGGLSAIYFAHDPEFRDRSLGTWNVLCLIDQAAGFRLPHVYLGYHTEGCPSLQYKARFRPNERLNRDGFWRDRANVTDVT